MKVPRLGMLSRSLLRAAARGITTDSVRHLVDASSVKAGMIDIRTLNLELDAQWPMK
ncbi:hypothetical protein [Magnetospirillum fulvum]|uniref:hypothetical protein n=1 Tax=Magnetospirillum fulvum TaxID=1082 RepID=UPI00147DC493|nr:hypothetical protein [Magnetospirillum fulvum]